MQGQREKQGDQRGGRKDLKGRYAGQGEEGGGGRGWTVGWMAGSSLRPRGEAGRVVSSAPGVPQRRLPHGTALILKPPSSAPRGAVLMETRGLWQGEGLMGKQLAVVGADPRVQGAPPAASRASKPQLPGMRLPGQSGVRRVWLQPWRMFPLPPVSSSLRQTDADGQTGRRPLRAQMAGKTLHGASTDHKERGHGVGLWVPGSLSFGGCPTYGGSFSPQPQAPFCPKC